MNLFLLSWDPTECARWHCDKHVVKMILELVQMLYTGWQINNGSSNLPSSAPLCKSTGKPGYKKAHPNHPMVKWVRESRWNYNFAVKLASALALEFGHRYGKSHACTNHIIWLSQNLPKFSNRRKTTIPQCMPDEYKCMNPVQAYRNYYKYDKYDFAKWHKRDIPYWFMTNEKAGGSNTNKSGLPFEEDTHLRHLWFENKMNRQLTKTSCEYEIKFKQDGNSYINVEQSGFTKYMESIGFGKLELCHGCKKPDEIYIDMINKIIFWIEKKNQNVAGSVSEKLQTAHCKRYSLEKNFPGFRIEYIFMLSNFFKTGHAAELDYLKMIHVPVFYIDEKDKIIDYIEQTSIRDLSLSGSNEKNECT